MRPEHPTANGLALSQCRRELRHARRKRDRRRRPGGTQASSAAGQTTARKTPHERRRRKGRRGSERSKGRGSRARTGAVRVERDAPTDSRRASAADRGRSLSLNYQLLREIVQSERGRHWTAHEVYVEARKRRPAIGFATVHRGLIRLCELAAVMK